MIQGESCGSSFGESCGSSFGESCGCSFGASCLKLIGDGESQGDSRVAETQVKEVK